MLNISNRPYINQDSIDSDSPDTADSASPDDFLDSSMFLVPDMSATKYLNEQKSIIRPI